MRANHYALAIVTLGLGMAGSVGIAQQHAPDGAPRSLRDGVYSARQVRRGAGIFENVCSPCHQREQFAESGLIDAWTGASVAELFDFVRSSMPEDSPGRLKPSEYADVLAFIFSANGLPAGEAEMSSDAELLQQILIEGPAAED
jgi:mono/diheme cytochrome c family protein